MYGAPAEQATIARPRRADRWQTLRATALLLLLPLTGMLAGCPGQPDPPADEPPRAVPESTESPDDGEPADRDETAEADRASRAGDGAEDAPAALTVGELRELRARLGLAPPAPPEVQPLLTRADVRELLRYQGTLTETVLPGKEPGPGYNAMRLATDDAFGVGVQLWRIEDRERLQRTFQRLQRTYIAAEPEADPVGDAAFSGDFDGLRHYAFRHDRSGSIVVITGDASLGDGAAFRALALRSLDRL